MSENSSSVNLKEILLEVLGLQNHSYSELAEHLGFTEKELDEQLTDKTLEVRTLELISKALRIPLYSFFRDAKEDVKTGEELYYNVDIWGKDGVQLRTTLKKDSDGKVANDELEKLKNELHEKEKLIKKIEDKLNKK
ncbi:MAG TPA: hypothetical protein VII99_05815 [Bacteroidia bacterium]